MRDISLYLSTIPDYNQMLAGKNVLITTAARGIGKSIALLFARQGADVYFGGRNEEYVRTTEKELQLIRPGCRGYVVDLAKADQTESFVDAAVKDSGGFDILVSTVGVNCHCPQRNTKMRICSACWKRTISAACAARAKLSPPCRRAGAAASSTFRPFTA